GRGREGAAVPEVRSAQRGGPSGWFGLLARAAGSERDALRATIQLLYSRIYRSPTEAEIESAVVERGRWPTCSSLGRRRRSGRGRERRFEPRRRTWTLRRGAAVGFPSPAPCDRRRASSGGDPSRRRP